MEKKYSYDEIKKALEWEPEGCIVGDDSEGYKTRPENLWRILMDTPTERIETIRRALKI